MSKKVAFFNANFLMTYFHEMMLSLAQEHIDQGDQVFIFSCENQLPVCDLNLFHLKTECQVCKNKQAKGRKLLSGVKDTDFIEIPIGKLTPEEKSIVKNYPIPEKTNSAVRNLSYNGFDLGWGVLSTISNLYREPEPDLSKIWDIVVKLIHTALSVYLSTVRFIKEHKIDLLYVLNGRYAYERAVMNACYKTNTEFYSFERGSTFDKIRLTHNANVHNIPEYTKSIREDWDNADVETRREVATTYLNKRAGVSIKVNDVKDTFKDANIALFTKHQNPDSLPEGFDPSKINITIFNSSEDEFRSLDESWKMTLFEDQIVAIKEIFEYFQDKPEYHIYLRVHPNLSNLDISTIHDLNKLNHYSNTTIIPAESKVSTYNLIAHSTRVVTFGSMVGAEATYHNKPSILLGHCFYQELNVAFRPETKKEAFEMMESLKEVKPQEDVLKIAYFLTSFGRTSPYFKAQDVLHCTYKGKNIHHLNVVGKIWRRGWQLPGFRHLLQPLERSHSDQMYKKMLEDG